MKVQLWSLCHILIVCLAAFICKSKAKAQREIADSVFTASVAPAAQVVAQQQSATANLQCGNSPREQQPRSDNLKNALQREGAGDDGKKDTPVENELKKKSIKANENEKSNPQQKIIRKSAEEILSLKKTQSERMTEEFRKRDSDKTKSSFDVKSVMEKGSKASCKTKRANSSLLKSCKTVSVYGAVNPTEKVTTAPPKEQEQMSGIDDLPLPLPDEEKSTQQSQSVRVR
ncbi:unnamed protein product [Anisakis simplex]|uniref:Uncharacterized protein n=1 Tax=Anisakis simplex TaxID=6269 RepID=A0A0M3J0F7_ANISI|nr:unnamed protein product [Anisakis simplex]